MNPPRSLLVMVGLCLMLALAGRRIVQLQAALDARPLVEDHKVDARTEDVRRGPITIKRKTTVAPDGTKTTESERMIGAMESHTEASSDSSHRETPAPAGASRTRYVGIGVDPLDYARLPHLRAGLTLWSVLDAGLAYDSRRPLTGGAVQLELAYRF